MNAYISRLLYSVLVVASLSAAAVAQNARPASSKFRVKKLIGLGAKARVFTPRYTTDVGRGIERAQEWQAVTLMYDTAPEWIDEILIQFYVLGAKLNPQTKRRAFSLYKTAVWYVDIEAGRKHMATAFLRPNAIARYGEAVAVAAVVTLEGAVVAEISDESMELPEKWWKNPLVTDSDATTVRENYLLDRSKSPWALINPDDYEVIK